MLYVDLDGFKRVNDTLGHAVGDQLLMNVGDRLRMSLRDSDVAARLGGDEFAVLLEGIPDQAAGENVAARIVRALGEPYTLRARSVSISASVGLAMGDPEAWSGPEELLKQADAAMYEAKESGKGRFQSRAGAPIAVAS